MIEALEETHPVSDLGAALGVSRARFYAWRQRAPSERDRMDAVLGEEIGVAFARNLAGVLDLGSRRPVGWAMGENLETSLPMDALEMAPRPRQPTAGLLHHSGRGRQYASEACRGHLAAWQMTPSMSRKGNCYDNAAMESCWSTLKEELVHRRAFLRRAEAAGAIFDYVETFYNRERLHSALGCLSPVEFEKQIDLN